MRKKIQRPEYLDKLIAFREKQLIKIVTGIRRCGKSTLLELYQEYLMEQGIAEEQIISINLEDFDFYELRKPERLHVYVKERLIPEKMNYVFVDEIQQCENFPMVVDSLYLKKKCGYLYYRIKCIYAVL